MKTEHKLCLLLGFLVVGSASAQERKIKRSELRAAVEKAVVQQSKAATVRGFSEERENGHTMPAVPAEVMAGLQAKAGTGEITKVESITKKDRLVAYEVHVLTDGKKSEVQGGPDGKPLITTNEGWLWK